MKKKYIITIILLTILAAFLELILILSTETSGAMISQAIQFTSVFAALIIAVIAMSIADPKVKRADIEVEHTVDEDNVTTYEKRDLPSDLQLKYESYPDPITSHRMRFRISNTSGFTLIKPTLTFRLPLEKQHPYRIGRNYRLTFNSNILNPQSEYRILEFGDFGMLSVSSLPYWNDGDEITIWIRMLLNDGRLEPFIVEISLNSENAEGITESLTIEPENVIT